MVEVFVMRIRRPGWVGREMNCVVVGLRALMRRDLVLVAQGQILSGWAAPKKALYRPAVMPSSW